MTTMKKVQTLINAQEGLKAERYEREGGQYVVFLTRADTSAGWRIHAAEGFDTKPEAQQAMREFVFGDPD